MDSSFSKIELHELLARQKLGRPEYTAESLGNHPSERFYRSTVKVLGKVFSSADAKHYTVRSAENSAAEEALKYFNSQKEKPWIESDSGLVKLKLQITCQKLSGIPPVYLTRSVDPSSFISTVTVMDKTYEGQPCKKKKLAEFDAARRAFQELSNGVKTGRQAPEAPVKEPVSKRAKVAEDPGSCPSGPLSALLVKVPESGIRDLLETKDVAVSDGEPVKEEQQVVNVGSAIVRFEVERATVDAKKATKNQVGNSQKIVSGGVKNSLRPCDGSKTMSVRSCDTYHRTSMDSMVEFGGKPRVQKMSHTAHLSDILKMNKEEHLYDPIRKLSIHCESDPPMIFGWEDVEPFVRAIQITRMLAKEPRGKPLPIDPLQLPNVVNGQILKEAILDFVKVVGAADRLETTCLPCTLGQYGQVICMLSRLDTNSWTQHVIATGELHMLPIARIYVPRPRSDTLDKATPQFMNSLWG